MKNKIFYLLLLIALNVQAQTIPSYKNIKLTATVENPAATKIVTKEDDNTFGYIKKSDLVDVIEVASAINLPSPGVAGKIYVTKDNNNLYRWNGTFYDQLAVTDISGKVDKVAGKGLSTEDYTTAEKSKLSGIQAAATANATDAQLRDRTTHTGTQAISTVTNLQATLDTKVDKVTGKSLLSDTEIARLATLNNYTHPATHPATMITEDATHRFATDAEKATWNAKQNAIGYTAENAANKNIANGYAGLGTDGKLISSQLPDITISDTFVVASQAAQLALVAQTGDVAVRTDLNKSFILKGTNSSVLSDWQELLTPTSAVTTVFGRAGGVTAQVGDYNADQITETTSRKFQTATQNTNNNATSPIQGQLDGKEPAISPKNTAFNKNFGTSAGTVVEGGTLGTNAYTSTAYLPLSGGSMSSSINRSASAGGTVPTPYYDKIFTYANTAASISFGNSGQVDSGTYIKLSTNGRGAPNTPIDNITITPEGSIFASTVTAPTFVGNLNGNASDSDRWGGRFIDNNNSNPIYSVIAQNSVTSQYANYTENAFRSWLGLGSNAYSSTAYVTANSPNSLNSWSSTNGFYGSYGINTGMPTSSVYWSGVRAVMPSDVSYGFELVSSHTDDDWYLRKYSTAYQPWRKLWHDGNFNPANYLPLTGGTIVNGLNGRLNIGSATNYIYGDNSNNIILGNINGDAFTINSNKSISLANSVTATAFFQSSDRRLKTILKRDGDVAYFKWKDGRDTKTHIGVIAQEVRKKFPDQVQKNEDGYLSVSYIEILVAKNRDLEKKLEALESRINQLEKSK